jgi:hypothetical protein
MRQSVRELAVSVTVALTALLNAHVQPAFAT